MHWSGSPACRSGRADADGSIRRLDSMSEGGAAANRGKAARTEYRDCTSKKDNERFPVAMRLGETPVLIPNTMVKT